MVRASRSSSTNPCSKAFPPQRLLPICVLLIILVNVVLVLIGLSAFDQHHDVILPHSNTKPSGPPSLSSTSNGVFAFSSNHQHNDNVGATLGGGGPRRVSDFVRQARSASNTLKASDIVADPQWVCFLALLNAFPKLVWKLQSCSLTEIVSLLGGPATVHPVLPGRCAKSLWWQQQHQQQQQKSSTSKNDVRSNACLWEWRVAGQSNRQQALINEALRRLLVVSPTTSASSSSSFRNRPAAAQIDDSTATTADPSSSYWMALMPNIFPVHFGVPLSSVVGAAASSFAVVPLEEKLFDFMPLLPGPHPHAHGPYLLDTIHDEWLLRILYERSLFAFTHNRGGWDSYRTYEILSAGCVPYFADLAVAPPWSVPHLPKDLLMEALALPGVEHIGSVTTSEGDIKPNDVFYREGENHINFARPGTVNHSSFDPKRYTQLRARLLSYTRSKLTTRHVATRVVMDRLGVLPTMMMEEQQQQQQQQQGEEDMTVSNKLKRKTVLIVTRGDYEYTALTILHGLLDSDLYNVIFVGKNFSESLFDFSSSSAATGSDDSSNTAMMIVKSVEDAEALRSKWFTGYYGNGFGFMHKLSRSANNNNNNVKKMMKRRRVRFFQSRSVPNKSVIKLIDAGEVDAVLFMWLSPDFSKFQMKNQRSRAMLEMIIESAYPFLKAVNRKFTGGKRKAVAFIDGTDTDTIPARSAQAHAALGYSVFVRELTRDHVIVK